MLNIKIKNKKIIAIILSVGLVISIIPMFFSTLILNIDILLMSVSAFALFLIMNLFINYKANTTQILAISVVNFIVFTIFSIFLNSLFYASTIKYPYLNFNIFNLIINFISIVLTSSFCIEIKNNAKTTPKEEIPLVKETSTINNNPIEKPLEVAQTPTIEATEKSTNTTIISEKEDDFLPENNRLKINDNNNLNSSIQMNFIGKTLVNTRDIENILESNALYQTIGQQKDNIISNIKGSELIENIAAAKSTYKFIKNISYINRAGYVLASSLTDSKKQHVLGAIFSGIVGFLEKYLNRVSLYNVEKIHFEMNNSLISFYCENQNIINVEYNKKDLQLTIDTNNNAKSKIVYLKDGQCIEAKNIENEAKFIAVNLAIFENFDILLKNFFDENIEKIIVFMKNDVLLISNQNDKLTSKIYTKDNFLNISKNIIEFEKTIEE